MAKVFNLLAVILTFGALTSCIEGDEVIWLEKDGSGRLEASYKMPTLVMNNFGGAENLKQVLEKAAAADEDVDLTRVAHRTEKGSVTFEFAGTFTSLQKLATFPKRRLRDPAKPDEPVQAEALFGETELKITDLNLELSRKVDLSGILPNNVKRTPSILQNSNFHYTVFLPVEVARTDATTVSHAGKKLEWTFLLKDYTDKSMTLYANAPLPIPWWIWLAGTLLALAFLAVLTLAIRRMILMRG